MSIKTQFIIATTLFCILLAVLETSVMVTNRQLDKVGRLETIAGDIAQGAGELGYLSQDYLIYHEPQQLERWQARYASFSRQVAAMQAIGLEHESLISNLKVNQQHLKEVFDSVNSIIGQRVAER